MAFTSRDIIKTISIRVWVVTSAFLIWFYVGLPGLAALFFEAYHLTGVESLYSIYGVLRFLTGHIVIWPHRLLTTIILGLFLFAILFWRARRRLKKGKPEGKPA